MFATFMFVVNRGQFSSLMTLTAFYLTLVVLIIFNIIVNDNNNYKSTKTWIGKGFYRAVYSEFIRYKTKF